MHATLFLKAKSYKLKANNGGHARTPFEVLRSVFFLLSPTSHCFSNCGISTPTIGFTKTRYLKRCSGQAAIVAIFFMVSILTAGMLGFSSLALNEVRVARLQETGKQSFFLSEAGQEDALYRVKNGLSIDGEEVLLLSGNVATTTLVNDGAAIEITSIGNFARSIRKVKSMITTADEVNFNYGVQVGEGGMVMANTSSVKGNLFSAGPITANGNFVYGDIIGAGVAGFVDDIHATGTVYAHTIQDSFIEKDAYYQTINGTTVLGVSYPESEDISPVALPIGDELIAEWKAAAESGGVIAAPCPYKIKSDTSIGPIKINCDLEIQASPDITLSGMVWVSGNVIIKNTPTIKINPGLGNKSLAIIADNPSNRITSSKIDSDNQARFEGSGVPGSYVLLLSQNESAEQGGGEWAIKVANQARGDLLIYTGHGMVELQNSVELREVTAHKILLKNSAQILYETGLANSLFDTGPGGSYDILDWKEIE